MIGCSQTSKTRLIASMQKIRQLIQQSGKSLILDETLIDIYDYPQGKIPDWQPGLSLPEFETVKCLYVDIETYTNNSLCLEYFAQALMSGKKLKNSKEKTDKPLVDFLLKHIKDDESEILKDYLLWRFDPIKHDGFLMSDSPGYNLILAELTRSLIPMASKLPLIDGKGALDPEKGVIVLIGLINEKGKTYVIDCLNKTEAHGLATFYHVLEKVQPTFLAHYNGFDFDFPFIHHRTLVNGLSSPFWVSDNPTIFRSAQRFGKPVEYKAFWLNYGKVSIVDLYHQALAWDFVNRKLTEFSLKKVVLALGLRKEERLVLSFEEMCKCVESGDLTKLKEYLIYDLEDSLLIGNFLLPDIYYQREILEDWNYQSISTGGFGTKWDDKITKEYQKINPGLEPPMPDVSLKFEGGLVGGKAGLYRNVSKIDVASLYPTVMLLYQVHSRKDEQMILLKILKYLLTKRLAFKAIATAKKGTKEGAIAKQRQGALKVMINSCFTGETLVTTNRGVYPMSELIGTPVKVINRYGEWSDVEFKSYGQSKIWNVTFTRNLKKVTLQCTPNHRWLASSSHRLYNFNRGKNNNFWWDEHTTDTLKEGMVVPHLRTSKPSDKNQNYYDGVVHGIIYGDGTFHNYKYSKNRFSVALANGKKELEKYFHKAKNIRWISTIELPREDLWARVSIENLGQMNLKECPKGNVSMSYILGFIRGLLATDGNICKRDGMTLITGKKEVCDWVEKWGAIVGFDFKSQGISSEKGRISDFGTHQSEKSYDIWNLKFDQSSLTGDDFLRDVHREIFINRRNLRKWKLNDVWKVSKIEPSEEIKEVYCCVEPKTSYFMLHGGILTGNCYGSFAVTNKGYNDYMSAAIVTGVGRAILRAMIEALTSFGVKVASFDTDGCYFASDSFETNKKAWEYCQSKMPGNDEFRVNLDYELEALAFYVPPITDEKKRGENGDEGLRKNYIIINKDGTIKANGKFRKRDKSILEKTFTPDLVKHFLEDTHKDFYKQTIKSLLDKTYPVDNLAVTRKIKANEKRLVELGLGLPGDVVTIWKGEDIPMFSTKTGKQLKKVETVWTDTSDNIDWQFYITMVNDMYSEFMSTPKY